MGGPATVCVQLTNGERLSYVGHYEAMASLACNYELLTAPNDERDKIAAHLVAEERRRVQKCNSDPFQTAPGLVPYIYGLNLFDLKTSRIWYCQDYTSLHSFLIDYIFVKDRPGFLKFAEAGMVRLGSHSVPDPGPEQVLNLPKVTRDELIDIFEDREGNREIQNLYIDLPGWDRRRYHTYPDGELRANSRFFDDIKAEYALTEVELEHWNTFFRELSS
jgi:hypothetical protein